MNHSKEKQNGQKKRNRVKSLEIYQQKYCETVKRIIKCSKETWDTMNCDHPTETQMGQTCYNAATRSENGQKEMKTSQK